MGLALGLLYTIMYGVSLSHLSGHVDHAPSAAQFRGQKLVLKCPSRHLYCQLPQRHASTRSTPCLKDLRIPVLSVCSLSVSSHTTSIQSSAVPGVLLEGEASASTPGESSHPVSSLCCAGSNPLVMSHFFSPQRTKASI